MTQCTDEDFIRGMQKGFLDCAEWADAETALPECSENTPYVDGNGFSDASTGAADLFVEKFYKLNKELLHQSEQHPDHCGHDLWLTIRGHGAGFWDRGTGDVGEKLTEVCERINIEIFVNEGGYLELEGI